MVVPAVSPYIMFLCVIILNDELSNVLQKKNCLCFSYVFEEIIKISSRIDRWLDKN